MVSIRHLWPVFVGAFPLAATACTVEPRTSELEAPLSGLYTPGSTLGMSDPSDIEMSSLGNRCLGMDGGAGEADEDAGSEGAVGTPGQLTLTYRTKSLMGRYAPHHCTAAWIEDADKNYVATLDQRCAIRTELGLREFSARACREQLGPDAVTSATVRKEHGELYEATWSGVDALGRPVADGAYTLYIEVSESDNPSDPPGAVDVFEFVKGPEPDLGPRFVAADGALVEVSLSWTPE